MNELTENLAFNMFTSLRYRSPEGSTFVLGDDLMQFVTPPTHSFNSFAGCFLGAAVGSQSFNFKEIKLALQCVALGLVFTDQSLHQVHGRPSFWLETHFNSCLSNSNDLTTVLSPRWAFTMDYIPLAFPVQRWAQTISHGEGWPKRQFSVSAVATNTEDLCVGATGYRSLADVSVSLSFLRGNDEDTSSRLERGIGILTHNEAEPARDDFPASTRFIGGWCWMPEDLYDEVWVQVRDHRYEGAAVELMIAPVVYVGPFFRWDTDASRRIWIIKAGVRFERRIGEDPASDDGSADRKPARKRWLW